MRPDVAVALAVVLDVLADRIAERIGGTRERESYSSRDLPQRCSRRRFAEVCRSGRVADAQREGRDWVCSRAAWDAARRRRQVAETGDKPRPLDEQADRLLARSGLRVIRSAQ